MKVSYKLTSPNINSGPTACEILNVVRNLGVENMWEDNKDPKFVEKFNDYFGGCKRRYPSEASHRECDIVIHRLWVEAKFSWMYTTDRTPGKRNSRFLNHLFSEKIEDHSALLDLRDRLPTLIRHPEVEVVGFLLVSFESIQHSFDTNLVAKLETDGRLDAHWKRSELTAWQNPNNDDCSIRAYYWERSAAL